MRVPVCTCTRREIDVGDVETGRDVHSVDANIAFEGSRAMNGDFDAGAEDLHLRHC